jgi:hypothetical protein
MSIQYDNYLTNHKNNVYRGYKWISENLPDILKPDVSYEYQLTYGHDASKSSDREYHAYDAYFYGRNRSYQVVQEFNHAWLHHIHNNPHHWQHWVLINDNPNEGEIILDMHHLYIIEMICDWWAFSWAKGNLYEIFSWYDEHKDYMKLSDKTRKTVDDILAKIKTKLDEDKTEENQP